MVTLAIESTTGSDLTYQLAKPVIVIGASGENDVVLRAPGVAPRHLVIQRNGDVYTFLAQSRQVVVLNGERRSRGVLRVGDRLRIGTATLVFKGIGDEPSDVEVVPAAEAAAPSEAGREETPSRAKIPTKGRSEMVLYSEPDRLAEARQQMVEIFRAGVRSDLVPSLRTFLETFFPDRQTMLSWREDDGRLQPVVSGWTGEVPRLPARTFAELTEPGRFGVLRLGTRQILLYPVQRGPLESHAYLLVETTPESHEDDEILLAELSRMLAVHWERVESSSSLFGPWEQATRTTLEEQLPGTSQAVKLLRDAVLRAARSSAPMLLCGRPSSGRTFIASLVAEVHPAGPLPTHVIEARGDDDAALRVELFGTSDGERDLSAGLASRIRGSVVVVRDVHTLSPAMQRELAALIGHDMESGYGPSVRWVATTDADVVQLLNEGDLDSTLFRVFEHHVVRVPSLSDRREDLPLLVVRLLDRIGSEQDKDIRGIELETLNSLLSHEFDGEMSELLAELRRLVSATPPGEMVRGTVLAGRVHTAAAEDGGGEDGTVSAAALLAEDDLKQVIPGIERLLIDRVLRRTLGNQSKAARILNLSRGALIAKIKEYDIPDYRSLRRSRR
jgi:DNA-binding NtrC family response regulator